ncbi:hypothetical protein AS034_02805 [[Bacillus] enclensis]|uniref:Uncharacterized protein n=2 Tax=Rossellomorea TaxID=2837508 RepID=A0A0V8HLC2_9BACI|nr:hypothetical protein [[Bacillus] enclensis]KSU63202.1 hypothetical protein AS034_02805 [[Bacillus] enclensis]QTC43046.1 hypothetical protein I7V34_07345 [Bacillus sp. V3]SCB80056.1 hypothetical protein GA0061094_0582 [[Bacillus] enclensis]
MKSEKSNRKWSQTKSNKYKQYFWSRFPFLFIPLSVVFFYSEDIMEQGFSEWEDLGRLILLSILPALVVSAFILSVRWRLKVKQDGSRGQVP